MTKTMTPEGIQLESICDYLDRKNYCFWRTNNAPTFDATRKVFRAISKHAMRGVSDIILLHMGKAVFIEVKSAKGRVSEHQQLFRQKVEAAGCRYVVARSIDDVVAAGY